MRYLTSFLFTIMGTYLCVIKAIPHLVLLHKYYILHANLVF